MPKYPVLPSEGIVALERIYRDEGPPGLFARMSQISETKMLERLRTMLDKGFLETLKEQFGKKIVYLVEYLHKTGSIDLATKLTCFGCHGSQYNRRIMPSANA